MRGGDGEGRPRLRRPPGLTLIADDLTGALDAACAFATPDDPVRVTWHPTRPRGPRIAHSTEGRDLPEHIAVARVAAAASARRADRHARASAPGHLWFKKLDSVMRGHSLAEIAAMEPGDLALAPAFPAQGRTTMGGRQRVHGRPVGLPLVPGLRARGIGAVRAARVGPGARVLDAATQGELDRACRGAGRPLWAGTGGLAEALARRVGASLRPVPAPLVGLFVIGTPHPVSAAQAEALHRAGLAEGVLDGRAPVDPGRPALLTADPCARGAEIARARMVASLRGLAAWSPRPCLVTGGTTLLGFCEALEAEALSCEGAWAPGLAVARLVVPQGRRDRGWDGTPIVTKSGGFGGADLGMRLLEGKADDTARGPT